MTRIILPNPPEKPDDIAVSGWRKAVRKQLLAWRSQMDPKCYAQRSAVICAKLADILSVRPNATIGFYWPIQNEIDLRPVISDHIEHGGKAAEMVPGFARIPEPVGTKAVPIHVMIAPLVGFDGRGYRLGYGGGFFDRTLAAMAVRPLVIGVGFEATRIADIFPHEYDIPVDIILTEAGIRPVSEKATGDFNRAEGASPPCFLSS